MNAGNYQIVTKHKVLNERIDAGDLEFNHPFTSKTGEMVMWGKRSGLKMSVFLPQVVFVDQPKYKGSTFDNCSQFAVTFCGHATSRQVFPAFWSSRSKPRLSSGRSAEELLG
jgi:hypothetical protein